MPQMCVDIEPVQRRLRIAGLQFTGRCPVEAADIENCGMINIDVARKDFGLQKGSGHPPIIFGDEKCLVRYTALRLMGGSEQAVQPFSFPGIQDVEQ